MTCSPAGYPPRHLDLVFIGFVHDARGSRRAKMLHVAMAWRFYRSRTISAKLFLPSVPTTVQGHGTKTTGVAIDPGAGLANADRRKQSGRIYK